MKKYILFLLGFLPIIAFSQVNSLASFETTPAFIKNHGQFDGRNWQKDSHIEYGIDYDDSYVFFTKKGLTYRFDKIIRNPNRDKRIHDSPKRTNISELIHVNWIGSNPDVEIIVQDEASAYYSYAIRNFETKEVRNENYIKGYKKLIYQNIYDNIDVEYIFHPETGFKYSIILHPGADVSQIKMKYSKGNTKIGSEYINYQLNQLGQIEIKASQGEITEHKPFTFYKNTKQELNSNFKFENDILSFNLENYDNTQEVVIDPWVQSPNFNSSTAVWEVETDGSGNVYVIGGETPMELRKYNSAGVWQWTYVTPWDTASVWLGTLATDDGGVSYITSGTSPEIERITTAGGMVWHTNGSGMSDEYWSITFNCDKTKLIVGGTILDMFAFEAFATIFDIDLTNGNVLGSQNLAQTSLMGIGSTPIEVRSISSSKDAKYVFLTHEEVGAINQNIGACPNDQPIFQVDNGHHLGYKCENYLPATQNGGGLKALVANDQYFYTNSGDQVHKRLLSDGSLITSVNLTGGNSSTVPIIGGLVVENSGLDVDDCGNVYAGSGDRVVKYDQDLNFISESLLPFTVYDVSINSNGEVIAVGSQADNQSVNRNGKIQAVNMSACAQFALVCCDANICPVDTVCDTDPPFNIDVSSPGGIFSGTGITNATTGTFDPSVAGVGTHIITYTQPCGFETVAIVVDPCIPIAVCFDGTNLIASGGTGPIIWEDWETYNSPINNEQDCIDCPTETPNYIFGIYIDCSSSTCSGTGWVQFGTGTTVLPPANWPMQVSDNLGVGATYNNIGEVPPCAPCTPPTLSAIAIDVICSGDNDGSIDLTVTPGSGVTYTYSWTGPSGFTSTSEDISGLLAGDYNITVTDATDPSCFAILTVTVNDGMATDDASFTVSDYCEGALNSATITGTLGGTFSFNPVPTNGETINSVTGEITGGIGGNTYTIEYTTNGVCPASSTQIVTVNANPVPSISGSTSFCTGGSTTLDAGAYSVYIWSTGATSQTIIVSTAGTYIVTVTDANGCTGTDQVVVTVASSLTPTITGILSICSGAATTLDAGTGYAGYLWSTTETTQTINVTAGGTYSVTVSDASGCTGIAQVVVTANNNPTPSITGSLSFCTGGSTILDAGAGYTDYAWNPSGTTQTITVNTAGTYTVTVTDANGCTGTDQVDVIVAANLSPTITGVLTICNGASTTLDAGTGYTSYIWLPSGNTQTISVTTAGTYSVTVSDASGCTGTDQVNVTTNSNPTPSITGALSFCTGNSTILDAGTGYTDYNWSPSGNTQTITVTSAGTYIITVTDANGCTGTDQVDVTVSANLSPSITGILSICSGNSTIIDAGGGYTNYLWNTTETTQTITITTSGTYSVIVSDANGCTGTDLVTVTANPNPTPTITGNLSYCIGSSTTLDAGSYASYIWNPSGNSQIINVNTEGTYSVTVTDVNGCTGTNSVIVTESEPIIANLSVVGVGCNGENTGAINVNVTGGNYTYNWSNGAITQNVSSLSAGIYAVTITDAYGCTEVFSDEVTEAPPLFISLPNDFYMCLNLEETITVSTTGGVPNYSYLWNTGETTTNINVSPTQTTIYTVIVTDANNCTMTNEITVYVHPPLQIEAFANHDTVCLGDAVLLSASYLGGSGPPYLLFIDGQSISLPVTVYPTNGQTYTFTIQDQCNNEAISYYTLYSHPLPPNSFAPDITEGCQPLTVQFIESSPDIGQTYSWNFYDENSYNTSSEKNPIHIFEEAGVYDISLTVTDTNGCINVDVVEDLITVYPNPHAGFIADPEIASIIKPLINFYNQTIGAVEYYWYFGDGDSSNIVSPEHWYHQTGSYLVELVVVSINNCKDTVHYTVRIKDEFTFYAPTAFSPGNNGINDYFKVFGSGIDNNNFKLIVFDRWGEIIFESDDINQGWDGRVKQGNDIVKIGSYTWLCTYRDKNGILHDETGSVTVIR